MRASAASSRWPSAAFEGVEEALTRIGANTYMMNAVRKMTAGAIDLGAKPSVTSAIAKYHVTERGRQVVNDGMDIIGGKGICLGPSNFLGRAYQQIPVGITVEGANILTRSLILFGQGAIRCHPYVLEGNAGRASIRTASRGWSISTRPCSATSCSPSVTAFRAFWIGISGSQLRQGAAQRRAGNAPLLPATDALLVGLRLSSPTSRCWSWAANSSGARSCRRASATSCR
jgi:hypothetical protein